MRRLYLRWAGVLAVGVLVVFWGARRYCNEVVAQSVESLSVLTEVAGEVRVLGHVGKLTRETRQFRLTGTTGAAGAAGATEWITVDATGDDLSEVRPLKTLVVIGRWTPSTRTLTADRIAPIPNGGYIAAAYLTGLLPSILFLFFMERRVTSLYATIKQEKMYEPEQVS
jgi:hypothetical protein